MALLQMLYWFE